MRSSLALLSFLLLVRALLHKVVPTPQATPPHQCLLPRVLLTTLNCAAEDVVCASLSDLYDAAGGRSWTSCTGWASVPFPADACTFNCVDCTKSLHYKDGSSDSSADSKSSSSASTSVVWLGTKVVLLRLRDVSMVGTLPDSLGNLTALRELDLYENALLQGPLPTTLGMLTSLSVLNFGRTNISGTIPEWIQSLADLTFLSMENSKLTGTLPESLGSLSSLQYLQLKGNSLTGMLPSAWGNMSSIIQLNLESNLLSGSLPDSWAALSTLRMLELCCGNLLSGTLPDWLATLPLTVFDSSSNDFYGPLPDFSQCPNLGVLDVSFNQLTGTLPLWIANLSNTFWLNVAANALTGQLPDDLSSWSTTMTHFDVNNCNLTGTLPDSLGYLVNLNWLDVSGNNFEGTIPASFSSLSAAVNIKLASNSLTGSVPPSLLESSRNLGTLDLSFNAFTGSLPNDFFSSATSLATLSLFGNNLSGTLPSTLAAVTGTLTALLIDDNRFSGSIPDAFWSSDIQYMDVSNNLFSGTLPDSVFMPRINVLRVRSNNLEGTIPAWLGSRTSLSKIDFGYNHFVSPIPDLTGLIRLQSAYFDGNNFTGALPPMLGKTGATQRGAVSLSLAHNQFTGGVPFNYLNFASLDLSSNDLSGELPDFAQAHDLGYVRLVPQFQSLDLSHNSFSGVIPASYGSTMNLLATLQLGWNNLSGAVPDNLSIGPKLKLCVLSGGGNNFTCPLPAALPAPCVGTVCYCPPGQYMNFDTGACAACSPGTYTLLPSLTACTPVLPGYVSTNGGSSYAPCPPFTFANPITNACDPCPPGTNSVGASTSCKPNTPGYRVAAVQAVNVSIFIGGVRASAFGNKSSAIFYAALALNYTTATVANASVVDAGGAVSGPHRRLADIDAPGVYADLVIHASGADNGAALVGQLTSAQPTLTVARLLSAGVLSVSSVTVLSATAQPTGDTVLAGCDAGAFLNGTSTCSPCAPGYYTSLTAQPACTLCSQSHYSSSATQCLPCPLATASPAGSTNLFNCSCAYGFYPTLTADNSSLICNNCPLGGVCDSTLSLRPLAQAGYWHSSGRVEMYACAAGMCIEESPGDASNCRTGHVGLLCSICNTSWTYSGDFCVQCKPDEAISAWPEARRYGLLFIIFFLGFTTTLPVLLSPLFDGDHGRQQGADGSEQEEAVAMAAPEDVVVPSAPAVPEPEPSVDIHPGPLILRQLSRKMTRNISLEFSRSLELSMAVIAKSKRKVNKAFANFSAKSRDPRSLIGKLNFSIQFLTCPLRIVLETFQLLTSFRHTMRVPWPSVLTAILSRLSVVGFSFLTLPNTACATPRSDYYSSFNGTTLGVTAVLLYVGGVSFFVSFMLTSRGASEKVVAAHRNITLYRILFLLTIFYAPLAGMILYVFNCTEVDGVWYIRSDLRYQCYTVEHNRFRAAGVFWAIVYVAGIPVAYWLALLGFKVPAMARRMMDDAHLYNVVEFAMRTGLELPTARMSALTSRSIKDDYLNILFDALKGKKVQKGAPLDSAVIGDVKCMPSWRSIVKKFSKLQRAKVNQLLGVRAEVTDAEIVGDARTLKRSVKLSKLIRYSIVHLMPPVVTWHPLLHNAGFLAAKQACGFLFEDYYADQYYFLTYEVVHKLMLTGVLAFVSPGTASQIAFGMFECVSFVFLMQAKHPYRNKSHRFVATFAPCILFLVLAFALILDVNVVMTANSKLFYNLIYVFFILALIIVPFFAVLRRLTKLSAGHDFEVEEDDVFLERDHEAIVVAGLFYSSDEEEEYLAVELEDTGCVHKMQAAPGEAGVAADVVLLPPLLAVPGGPFTAHQRDRAFAKALLAGESLPLAD